MEHELSIVIYGKSGSGKSTVAAALAEFLREKGAQVSVHDVGSPGLEWQRAVMLSKVAPRLDVSIKVVQTKRLDRSES